MEITLKTHKDTEKKYLEYYDSESGKRFTNNEYFVFDVMCDDFKHLMYHTGGFCAEITTRTIEKNNLPCERIMFCQTPQTNNEFYFQIVYLGKFDKVLQVAWGNNYFDYEYFKNLMHSILFILKQYL